MPSAVRPCLAVLFLLPSVAVEAAARPGGLAGPVDARIVRIVDGDTISVRATIWIDIEISVSVRIRGIDAPELRGGCEGERELAKRATAFLGQIVGEGRVTLSGIAEDKFSGRIVADVTTEAGVELGPAMRASGLARDYEGGARQGWCGLAGLGQ